jgi:predicted O-methyltransferase YrrM
LAVDCLKELGTPANVAATLDILRKLTPDRWHTFVAGLFESKLASGAPFWELCCALNLIASERSPRNYLEIGVRRGKSMAQVACQSPDCRIVGFDAWVSPYAEVENPGPEFVAAEMRLLGHRGRLELISGDSRETVPEFLKANPDLLFDLVTVDGDHSEAGAMNDLRNVTPRLAPRGMLVFDDLINVNCPLASVWEEYKGEFGALLVFRENLLDHQGTGIAMRIPR